MSKFFLRFSAGFLTFTLGLAGSFLFNQLTSVIEGWIEGPEPVLIEPCAAAFGAQANQRTMIQNCGRLVVQIGNDRRLWLNGHEIGSLDDVDRLVTTLNQIFARRTEDHVYRAGFELNSTVPAEQLIEKTVLISAPRRVSFGEVSDLIDVIRMTGAKPIGLGPEGIATVAEIP